MKTSFRIVACAVVLLAAVAGCAGEPRDDGGSTPLRLRVLSYNIHHGEGTDGKFDLERIARVIRAQGPDLVALQEVDVKTRRSGGVDQAAELGRLTGMRVTFGRAIDYEGGQYGQAILSRVPPEDFKLHVLPGDPQREQRAAVASRVRPWGKNGPRVRFVGTHLHHLDETDRLAQAAELNKRFTGDETPTVLVGDLNARPDSRTMATLLAHWQDASAGSAGDTFPAGAPDRRIDYILLRPTGAWRVVESRVVEEPVASDHRPVAATLEWVVN
jgi:endonuclease/exonuclease/phosphatase family metal-dependent hydrolase